MLVWCQVNVPAMQVMDMAAMARVDFCRQDSVHFDAGVSSQEVSKRSL